MIKVVFSLDKHYTYLSIKGHADYADAGKDLVCAAVSSIVFGLMNAIDESKEAVEIADYGNKIEIINNSSSELIDNYFELVIFQLKTIEESYGRFIEIERK